MRTPVYTLVMALLAGACSAQTNFTAGSGTNVLAIDLPSTLQLAGARSLDVQTAREKLTEAKAIHESSVWQFFPSITPGIGYRRHDNLIQDVAGNITDVHKDSYTVGPTIAMQLDLGDAIYKKLAARQLVTAAESALETQHQESVLNAVKSYFDLTKAQAATRVTAEAVRISNDYAAQVKQAVTAGIAFKGDALRAEVQADRNKLALRQAEEESAAAAARLSSALHLDFKIILATPVNDLVPLALVATNTALDSLVSQALAARPEVKQSHAQIEAARKLKDGAKYGPLVPALGAQVFAGGLGGGIDGGPGRFGESEDYQLTLGWKIGPGGLFDRGRIRASEARLKISQIEDVKTSDKITREVVESQNRMLSLSDQLSTVRHTVQASEEALRLADERKEFAVGLVLEHVQAEQELTRARLDYLTTVSEFNKAQFTLKKAIGPVPGTAGQ